MLWLCLGLTFAWAAVADAQYWRGYGPRGPLVVAPIPPGALWHPRHHGGHHHVPPSGVRVRTPLFSLNLEPGGYVPPRVHHHGRYKAYRPSSPSGYRGFPPHEVPVPPAYGQYRHRYRPGEGGGVPDLTEPVLPRSQKMAVPTPRYSRTDLISAAMQLRTVLMRLGEQGQVWDEYLQPQTIIEAAEHRRLPANAEELVQRYRGVIENPELRHVAGLGGFAQTHRQLAAWLREQAPREATTPSAPAGQFGDEAAPGPPADGSSAEDTPSRRSRENAPRLETLPPPRGEADAAPFAPDA